MSKPK